MRREIVHPERHVKAPRRVRAVDAGAELHARPGLCVAAVMAHAQVQSRRQRRAARALPVSARDAASTPDTETESDSARTRKASRLQGQREAARLGGRQQIRIARPLRPASSTGPSGSAPPPRRRGRASVAPSSCACESPCGDAIRDHEARIGQCRRHRAPHGAAPARTLRRVLAEAMANLIRCMRVPTHLTRNGPPLVPSAPNPRRSGR